MTQQPSHLTPVATFCGHCDCGCPELYVDPSAAEEKRLVLTDDFGQRVQMSPEQFGSLVAEAKSGALDHVVPVPAPRHSVMTGY